MTRSKGASIAGGVAVAVIVAICLLIALAWYCRSRSQGEKRKKTGNLGCILACYFIHCLFRKLDSRIKGCSRCSSNEANDEVAYLRFKPRHRQRWRHDSSLRSRNSRQRQQSCATYNNESRLSNSWYKQAVMLFRRTRISLGIEYML